MQPMRVYYQTMLCSAILFWAVAALAQEKQSLARFTFSEIHMGAPWKIVLYARDETTANHAAQAAYARVEELNRILSDYDPNSELSRLSATSPSPHASTSE